jgi:Fe2+ or Zn2+ uptake regulation protein
VVAVSLIHRRSPARERIYQTLLTKPARQWTVQTLLADLARRSVSVSDDAARVTLYLLAQARLMTETWHEHTLLFTLTPAGEQRLRQITASWRLPSSTSATTP